MGDYDSFADQQLHDLHDDGDNHKAGDQTAGEQFQGSAFGSSPDNVDPQPDNVTNLADLRLAHTGQIRFAHRLADRAVGLLLSCYGRGWITYDGTRWADDHLHDATRLATAVITDATAEAITDPTVKADWSRCTSARGIQGVLDLAQADERLAITVDDLDPNPWLLNCHNGTLDLHTGQLRPHDPDDRITKVAAADYVPGARSAAWQGFLASSLPDEAVRGFLQRYIGLALVGEVIEHRLLINIGAGRNGKSIFSAAITDSLGDYAKTMSTSVLTLGRAEMSAGTSSEIMQLQGVRAVFMSEIAKGARLDESLMKNLTGGDAVVAKRMRQDPVEFTPSHSLIMSVNDLPTVAAESEAVWARILAVPWTVSFLGREDPTLKDKLATPEARSAILAWAIQGLSDYQRVGLDPPPTVLARTDEYRKEMDSLARFLAERCLTSPIMSVRFRDLFAAFQKWATAEGMTPMGRKAFRDDLPKHGLEPDRSHLKVIHGLGLRADEESDDESSEGDERNA